MVTLRPDSRLHGRIVGRCCAVLELWEQLGKRWLRHPSVHLLRVSVTAVRGPGRSEMLLELKVRTRSYRVYSIARVLPVSMVWYVELSTDVPWAHLRQMSDSIVRRILDKEGDEQDRVVSRIVWDSASFQSNTARIP